MKKHISLFVFFFVIGLIWGKFFYYSEKNRSAIFKNDTLVILAEENFLPVDVIESFAMESGLNFKLLTYKNRVELINLLKNKNADLIAFKSFYAKDVLEKLSKVSYKEISNKDFMSVDFKNSPQDPENQFAIPFFWGVEKASSSDSFLWVESIGILKESNFKKEAHEFLDYVLQTDVALEVVRHRKVASTNRSIEKSKNIEPKHKPSYLRKISIRNLRFNEQARF